MNGTNRFTSDWYVGFTKSLLSLLCHKMRSPPRSPPRYALTNQQENFIKIAVVANASFTDWAYKARSKLDGTLLFPTDNEEFFIYCRSSRFLSQQRSYNKFLKGQSNAWKSLKEDEIDPFEYVLETYPIRALTKEEYQLQRSPPQKMARGQTPPRGKKPIDDSDDVGSTGEATHVSQLFRYEDGCHTFFPGNLNTVFAMENEQYDQMTSLAKPLKVGAKNWGFRNALLALGHGVTVPNTGGICSAYFLRVPADIHDVHRYRLAVLRSPDNNILMLEAPSSDHTESEGDLENYMAELQITTER